MIKNSLLIGLICLVLFGCTSQQTQGGNVFAQGASNLSNGKLVEINVTAKKWDFTPNTITLKEGDHVRLFLTSEDVVHGFMLKDYNINVKIEPGQVTTVDFIANSSGEFQFRCSVLCGEGHRNQTGKLIVEPG